MRCAFIKDIADYSHVNFLQLKTSKIRSILLDFRVMVYSADIDAKEAQYFLLNPVFSTVALSSHPA